MLCVFVDDLEKVLSYLDHIRLKPKKTLKMIKDLCEKDKAKVSAHKVCLNLKSTEEIAVTPKRKSNGTTVSEAKRSRVAESAVRIRQVIGSQVSKREVLHRVR